MADPLPPRRIAVVGSGIAGLVAAHVAASSDPPAHVTLYEADDRLGGHADTHSVSEATDELAIDTGFIVHNRRTYPTLLRLFDELGVETQESEMSLSVSDDETGLEWAGALGPRGLFPTASNLARPAYLRMLGEIPRFHSRARRVVSLRDASSLGSSGQATGSTHVAARCEMTLRAFLEEGRFSAYFLRHFMEPLVAAVWSCDPGLALDYPARYLFTFLDHHGLLRVFGSPAWRTVTGGSREYVDRIAAELSDLRVDSLVTSVLETPSGVEVRDGNGVVSGYDACVIATHPDRALAMLAEPTVAQREVLGALPYSQNGALLHTDSSMLPRAEGARASWNFRRVAGGEGLTVTYDLTRLQRLPTDTRYLLTLGGDDLVDPAAVIARRDYSHPIYTPASVAAQRRLPEISSDRLAFAGAYHGWGFHEDGARSGVVAAERLGFSWGSSTDATRQVSTPARWRSPGSTSGRRRTIRPASTSGRRRTIRPASTSGKRRTIRPASTSGETVRNLSMSVGRAARAQRGRVETDRVAPAGRIYRTTISHTRRVPFRHTFTNHSHTWLVDLDDLPDHGLLGRFEARDHLGDPGLTIRGNVDAFLARHDVELDGGRVLMAAMPRAFGYCFNPLSVYWCFGRDGDQRAVVVEVHNTYGDRHAYLVHPDEQGHARTDKQMYVSPFHGTDGHYELAVPVPGDRLDIAVTLHSDADEAGTAKFSASLHGVATIAGRHGPLRAAPAAALASLQIRAHGVWLWLRRLPVRPRPAHHQEGVSPE